MIYTVTLNPALDRELSVPRLETNTVLRAGQTRLDYGGKGFNVSRALLALGQETTALGFVGGHTGQILREGLEGLGISTRFIPVAGETRTNVSIVDRQRCAYVKVNEPGPMIQPAEIQQLLDQVTALARPGDWFILSGSLPPGVKDGIYADLIRLAHASGARVLLDTSGPALRLGCQAAPEVIKPNAFELEELAGRKLKTPEMIYEAARRLVGDGSGMVVVSLGRDGAALFTAQQGWQADAPRIVEANPIGAGDAMVAGLVYGLTAGLPPESTLAWGMACGAAAASLPGTAVGTREQVSALVAHISPRRLL